MTSRPATLSLNQLSSALDKAVGLAAQKHNLRHGEKNTIFINWELIGRRLLEADLKAASQFSETVSAGLKEAGINVEPVTIVLPKGGIIAGVFPVERINELQF